MKLSVLFVCLLAVGLRAANPSFPDLIQTNFLWVAKNGNNSTAKPGSPALKYSSISNAVQAAVAPAQVIIAPGLYNESVILRDRINLQMPSGVIVSQSVSGLDVLSDNGLSITNSLSGDFTVIHSSSGFTVGIGLHLTGASTVSTVNRATIRQYANTGSGLSVSGGASVRFYGDIIATNQGCEITGSPSFYFNGTSYGARGYGILASGGGSSNYITGMVVSDGNSAIHIGNGFCLVENAFCVSTDDTFGWGVEQSGGIATIKNSVLQPSKHEAIGKYGGGLMIVDGCQLIGGTNSTYSIDNDGNSSHGSLIIVGTYANKPPNPEMNIIAGTLNVSNSFTWKSSQIFKSVHDLTNMVARTNGNTWFPAGAASYSTLATNAIGGTGYTNNQEITQTAYLNGVSVAVTLKDRSGTTIMPATTFTGTLTVTLQPGWAVTAASGLTGTAVPW